MKAILDENHIITIYPETVAEKIVIRYMIEEDSVDKFVTLEDEINESGRED